MKITHLGHACLLVEAADRRVLIDPGNFSTGYADLTGLDAVLVTHNHADHFDPEAAPGFLRANAGVPVHTDPLTATKLREQGLDAAVAVRDEPFRIGDIEVTPVGELHAFNHEQAPVVPNVGYVLRVAGEPTLFHPGDSYASRPSGIDILAHPLNAPWMAVRDAIAFVGAVAPRTFIPIHDALLSAPGRAMYSDHVQKFSGVEGLEFLDIGDGQSHTF